MSVGFYMNMEKMSLNIVKEHLQYMTNDNILKGFEDLKYLDQEKLEANIKNGFIIITQLSIFIESFLNTILNNCVKYESENILKSKIEEKLEIIFLYYRKELITVRSNNYWKIFKEMTSVRNEMIHFKGVEIDDGLGLFDFKIKNISVNCYFTKGNMENLIDKIIKLSELIAEQLDLKIFSDINIFQCDAKDGIGYYVYENDMINNQ